MIYDGHADQEKVSQCMSGNLFGVAEEDNWLTIADMFREKHVRRLPVLREGELVGIVTRHDLMRAIQDARQRVRRQLAREADETACQADAKTASTACEWQAKAHA